MGHLRWAGTTSPSPTQHLYPTNQGHSNNQGNLGGATAVFWGAAVVKRESYGGGGSKGMEGIGGSALKQGHKWVLGLGNGV